MRIQHLFLFATLALVMDLPAGATNPSGNPAKGTLAASEAEGACAQCNAAEPAPTPLTMPPNLRAPVPLPPIDRSKLKPSSSSALTSSPSFVNALMKAIRNPRGIRDGQPRGYYADRNLCYRGVKNILQASGVISAKTRNSNLKGGAAYDAMKDLKTIGMVNEFPKSCNSPGTIRVYEGDSQGQSARAAEAYVWKHFHVHATDGDRYGHIEIVTNDHRYCHFACSSTPIDAPSRFGPKRRILKGCFVKP